MGKRILSHQFKWSSSRGGLAWLVIMITIGRTWRSGYCYLNKGECNLNQSKDGSFVERVPKNNSWNNGDRHKIHEIFIINCFVFVITLVWKIVQSWAMTRSSFNGKNIANNCFQVTVPVLTDWTKKPFGHHAAWNFFPQDHQEGMEYWLFLWQKKNLWSKMDRKGP